MESYDVHIKGGTIVDGTRVPRYQGDMWIKDGRIAQIGGRANGAVGAGDRRRRAASSPPAPSICTPTTTPRSVGTRGARISGWHGVTSVVLGNCGFGFAPVKPDFRERSMLTMVRTEAIPMDAMREGFLPKWDWETIPEYLDSLERAPPRA